VLSAEATKELDVCGSQVLRKELGIISTFGGANFDDAFHGVLQINGRMQQGLLAQTTA
jgi:hypothetical protein